MKEFKTVGDRIIIEPITNKEVIPGMELPDSRGIPQRGKVIARGIDVRTVQDNDEVFYAKGAGISVNLQGKDVVVMREGDLFAIL